MNSKLRDIITKAKALKLTGDKRDDLYYLTTVEQDEKAIGQAVGEEMLRLLPPEIPNVTECNCCDECSNSQPWERGYNELRAELRQKIKEWQGGEDGS